MCLYIYIYIYIYIYMGGCKYMRINLYLIFAALLAQFSANLYFFAFPLILGWKFIPILSDSCQYCKQRLSFQRFILLILNRPPEELVRLRTRLSRGIHQSTLSEENKSLEYKLCLSAWLYIIGGFVPKKITFVGIDCSDWVSNHRSQSVNATSLSVGESLSLINK